MSKHLEPSTQDARNDWWWTPARQHCACAECRETMPKGSAIAYRHTDNRAVCETCADRLGLAPQASKAWKRSQQAGLIG